MARVTRCKGRTASGRILPGYRLTKGGLVKAGTRKRKASTRKPRGLVAAAAAMLGTKPPAASKRRRARRKPAAAKRRRASSSAPARAASPLVVRRLTGPKAGAGVIVVGSGGTAYLPADAALAPRSRFKPLANTSSRRFVALGAKPPARSRKRRRA